MKAFNKKNVLTCAAVVFAMVAMTVVAGAESGFNGVINPVVELIESLLTPLLAVVGAAGSLYCVFLGVKFAKAEEPQDREKAKSALKNAIIGFVLIFVLMLALKILMPSLTTWVSENAKNAVNN